MVNLIDSELDNERLVVIWNTIEDKTDDIDIKDYAKRKRENLIRLRESKKESDKNKNAFDLKYAELIEKEIKEVQSYEESLHNKSKRSRRHLKK